MTSREGSEKPWPLSEILEAEDLGRMLGMPVHTVREYTRRPSTAGWFPRPAGRIGRSLVWIRGQVDVEKILRDRPEPGGRMPSTPPL